jgi:hypothetical protein
MPIYIEIVPLSLGRDAAGPSFSPSPRDIRLAKFVDHDSPFPRPSCPTSVDEDVLY